MALDHTQVRYLVVHCTATPETMWIDAKRIRDWHTDPKPQGNGWSRPGYHDLIIRNGKIQTLNSIKSRGIHVRGYNSRSVAVCLVGGSEDGDDAPGWQGEPSYNFEDVQIDTLIITLNYLQLKFPRAEIVGHRDLDDKKACPSFDVRQWWLDGHDEKHSKARSYGV